MESLNSADEERPAPKVSVAVIRAALGRARDRVRRGDVPRRLQLPEAKSDFPKALFLDQSKWIDLARAHYGRRDGAAFREALDAVRSAVNRGSLVVPLTQQNIEETATRRNQESRERLARFMIDLSQNHSMLYGNALNGAEIACALRRCYLAQPAGDLRKWVLHHGLHASYGRRFVPNTGNVEVDRLMLETFRDPEMAVVAIVNYLDDDDVVADSRKEDDAGAARLAAIRTLDADLAPREKRRRELAKLFNAGSFAERVMDVAAELGIWREAFHQWTLSADNRQRLAELLPEIDIAAELMFRRDRNPSALNDRNDVKDLEFLRVGITYGNIVVTENLWTSLANSAGIAAKYGTVVIADLRKLPGELERIGISFQFDSPTR